MVLKRIVGVIGRIFRSGASNAEQKAVSSPGVVGSILTKNSGDIRVQQANQDLADAIKTLSHSTTMINQRPNVESQLHSLETLNLQTMPLSEIEELARLHFEGSPQIEKNPAKAVELWTVAADRGSVEAKYSRALCLKDGLGIEKNEMQASEELRYLSNEKNYHLAHVIYFRCSIMY